MKFKELIHKISSFIRNLFFHFRVLVALDVGKKVGNDQEKKITSHEDSDQKGD